MEKATAISWVCVNVMPDTLEVHAHSVQPITSTIPPAHFARPRQLAVEMANAIRSDSVCATHDLLGQTATLVSRDLQVPTAIVVPSTTTVIPTANFAWLLKTARDMEAAVLKQLVSVS